jgi:uncharacterized membrane protein YphA (DoxX/SURF4 family)
MNIALWGLQGLLAVVFLGAGSMKLLRSKEQILANKQMGWAIDFSPTQIKLLAILEVLGALGLVLPWALGVVPILTPVAALCLTVIIAGAVATHAKRHEPWVPTAVLAGLLLLVAAGRFIAS